MSILVLDIGTTSMRGILYDCAGNKLAVESMKNHPIYLDGGIVSESAADWEMGTCAIFRQLLRNNPDDSPEAIVVTSQRSSIIPIDRDGIPLMDTIMWQDTRNRKICEELESYNDSVFAKTGSRVNSVFSGSKMTWIRENEPEIYSRTFKFLNIPEYIMFLMTGEFHSDYTYASRTGLMNIRKKQWDQQLLDLYRVEQNRLCDLHEPGTVIGRTGRRFQQMTGCTTGIPVITAGGDQQCAAIGQGVTKSGCVSIVTGTGGFIVAACDNVPANLTDNVICNCSSIAGKYILEANVLTCSAAFDWAVREILGMETVNYSDTERILEEESEPASCLVIPYFQGRGAPDWDPAAKAVFADISLKTRRGELLKAVMEGVFLELANHLDELSAYTPLERIYISGGITASRSLNQLQADVYGYPLIARQDRETTAKGALLVALVSLGISRNIEEAWEGLQKEQEEIYSPDFTVKHPVYEKKRIRMNEIYERIKHENSLK